MKLSLLAITTTAVTMVPQGVLSHDKLRGAQPIASDAQMAKQYQYEEASIEQEDMDALVDAFCGAAVAISDAFWNNGGKHHRKMMPTLKRHVMLHMMWRWEHLTEHTTILIQFCSSLH